MKLLVRLIPYAIVVVFALLNTRMQQLNDALIATGARQPNESTDQVWEIAYRGGAFRYVTFQEYITYYAPFVMGPLFIGAVIWIILDLRKAGFFGGERQ